MFKEIVKNDTPVYLALDSDAKQKSNKLIRLFLKYGIEIYNIDVAPYSDVGEMSKEEFKTRKNSAEIVTAENYLLNRINNMQRL